MRKDEDCACINILQFRTTLSLQKHYISWTQKRKPGQFIQKFGTQILKIVYIAKYSHAFFSANYGMQKLFCLLSYSRQANCQIQSFAYPFNSSTSMIELNQVSSVQIFIRNHSSVEFSPILRGSTLPLVPIYFV